MNKQNVLNALEHIDGAAALVSAIANAEEVADLDQACFLIEREIRFAVSAIRKELDSVSETAE